MDCAPSAELLRFRTEFGYLPVPARIFLMRLDLPPGGLAGPEWHYSYAGPTGLFVESGALLADFTYHLAPMSAILGTRGSVRSFPDGPAFALVIGVVGIDGAAGLYGRTYVSASTGFALGWDASWDLLPFDEPGAITWHRGAHDTLRLGKGSCQFGPMPYCTLVSLEGFGIDYFGGRPADCIADAFKRLTIEMGEGNVQLEVSENSLPNTGDDSTGATARFISTVTPSSGDGTPEYVVDHVDCRVVPPGGGMMRSTIRTDADEWDRGLSDARALLSAIVYPSA